VTEFAAVSDLLDELARAAETEEAAWEDVLARAALLDARSAGNGDAAGAAHGGHLRRSRPHLSTTRRRGLLVVAVAALALVVVVVAAGYALGHPIIDFGTAPKAPPKVVKDFGSLQVGAPPGMAPNVLPHQTRRITSVRIDGKKHVLWVAPTKQGGFCDEWSDAFGGCRADRNDTFASHIDVTVQGTRNDTGVAVLGGSFFQSDGERLQVAYADGTSADIPFVWVTAPIDAGFYLYRVPDANRVEAHRPVSVTLLDGSDKVLDREDVVDVAAEGSGDVMHRLPGYGLLPVPATAVWAKRRQLFDLRAGDGAHLGLWIAPARGGGTCYWTNQGSGCTSASSIGKPPALGLGFEGGVTHVNLCCTVGPRVARVEARFQDGDRIELTPKDGYLLWTIPSRHFARGHRIYQLFAYDSAGHTIAARQLPLRHVGGLYPCAKPRKFGNGGHICP
jgi:hypothetical protein